MKSPKILFVLTAVLATIAALHAEFITYTFDSAGRLTSANYGSGKTTTFQYDGTGNLTRTANNITVDSDNDGMADSWELTYFGSLARDGSGDFDGDGLNDVSEYFAGTLPNNASSLLKLDRNVTNSIVQTSVGWSSVSGKTYRLQFKNSLSDSGWNDVPGDVLASSTNSTKIDTTTAGKSFRFYRVQVVP